MIVLSSTLNSFIQLIGVLIIFAFVLIITYFTTKWVGGFQKAQMVGSNLQVVETVRIANGNYVQILQLGDVYLVIAVGKERVTMLAQLTKEQMESAGISFADSTSAVAKMGMGTQETFQEVLQKLRDRFPKKQG